MREVALMLIGDISRIENEILPTSIVKVAKIFLQRPGAENWAIGPMVLRRRRKLEIAIVFSMNYLLLVGLKCTPLTAGYKAHSDRNKMLWLSNFFQDPTIPRNERLA
jgi:hypothetical protein